jgi:hypothetical protein
MAATKISYKKGRGELDLCFIAREQFLVSKKMVMWPKIVGFSSKY